MGEVGALKLNLKSCLSVIGFFVVVVSLFGCTPATPTEKTDTDGGVKEEKTDTLPVWNATFNPTVC